MNLTCGACHFWNGRDFAEKGGCHRLPPQAAPGVEKLWPQTLRGDWCGEHSGLRRAREPVAGPTTLEMTPAETVGGRAIRPAPAAGRRKKAKG